jgi:hypothetical protein
MYESKSGLVHGPGANVGSSCVDGETSLHGVASLFCRSGPRPRANDPEPSEWPRSPLRDVQERRPHLQLLVGSYAHARRLARLVPIGATGIGVSILPQFQALLSARDVLSADPPAQCVVVDAVDHDNKPPQLDHLLCVRGVFNSARPADTDGSLSENVARWLPVPGVGTAATNSEWWDCKAQVQFDLGNQDSDERPRSRVLPRDVALERANPGVGPV